MSNQDEIPTTPSADAFSDQDTPPAEPGGGIAAALKRAKAKSVADPVVPDAVVTKPSPDEYNANLSQGGMPTLIDISRTWIMLEESDEIGPTGHFFSVNGVAFMLMPGVPAYVPNFVLEVLDLAVQSKPILNEKQEIEGYRHMSRLPYKVLRNYRPPA